MTIVMEFLWPIWRWSCEVTLDVASRASCISSGARQLCDKKKNPSVFGLVRSKTLGGMRIGPRGDATR